MSNQDRINNDPLARIIAEICLVMKTDFGRQYASQFKADDDLRLYKRRLYSKLRDFDVGDIADAYELFVESGKTFCPTIPELLEHVKNAQEQRRQREEAAKEVSRVAALPPPTIQCDPLAMLAEAKQAVKQRKDGVNIEERLAAHNAVVVLFGRNIKKREFGPEKCCEVGYCKKPGALSHNTKGGGPFYCLEHYRQAG